MLHLLIINYDYNAASATANDWLDQADNLTRWGEDLQKADVEVTVFQRFLQDAVIKRNQVTYHLVCDTFAAKLPAWQIPRQIHWGARVLCAAHVQVEHAILVQVNGLHFPLQIRYLRSLLPPVCPLIVQHQGERPWSAPYRPIQRWGLQVVDGFLFSNPALAQEWMRNRIIDSPQKIYAITADTAAQTTTNPSNQAAAIYASILHQKRAPITRT